MKHKRVCSRCHELITRNHRWHYVHKKFLFWTFTRIEHRDCKQPHLNPNNPYGIKRLKGEVPLPFDEQIAHDALYHGMGQEDGILLCSVPADGFWRKLLRDKEMEN